MFTLIFIYRTNLALYLYLQLLQMRIYEFVSTAERMMRDQRVDSSRVNQEIQTMQKKWSTFRTEVTTNRKLIDISIEYYKTIEGVCYLFNFDSS